MASLLMAFDNVRLHKEEVADATELFFLSPLERVREGEAVPLVPCTWAPSLCMARDEDELDSGGVGYAG